MLVCNDVNEFSPHACDGAIYVVLMWPHKKSNNNEKLESVRNKNSLVRHSHCHQIDIDYGYGAMMMMMSTQSISIDQASGH